MMSHADEEEQDLIKNFLNEFVLSVPHQLIADSDAGLVLSLNHRLPEVRQTAVQTLIRNRDEVVKSYRTFRFLFSENQTIAL